MKAITLHQPWATLCVTRASCPRDRNGDGDCGMRLCPDCGGDGSKLRAVKWIVDQARPAPAELIGQRIAIHASTHRQTVRAILDHVRITGQPKSGTLDAATCAVASDHLGGDLDAFPLGAVVGSAVLSACVPMVEDVDDLTESIDCIELSGESAYLWRAGEDERPERSVRDQLPFGMFEPGRWAWLLADAAPTTERCPWCWGDGDGRREGWPTVAHGCPVCSGAGRCEPIPARGRQRMWEWSV